MMRLKAAKRILDVAQNSGLLFFRPQMPPLATVPTRQFNQSTLDNAHQYLIENKGKIKFEKNESGFIRTTFPDSVLTPGDTVAPLQAG